MQPLDPLTISLKGQVLIEASAGTGKTYTIAFLFLRLLLEKKLSVDQILIVTFTKAATEELRGRVRLRIREALDCLQGQESRDNGQDQDKTLTALIETIGEDERETAAILLTDALLRMDEAAIFTIHGFCQRMLQEHAFESGSPFAMEFLENEETLRRQIIEDFWRNRFYKAGRKEAEWVLSLWETPLELLDKLRGHVFRHGVKYIPRVRDSEIEEGENVLEPLFKKVRLLWEKEGGEISGLLYENKKLSRDKNKGYGVSRLDDAVATLNRFCSFCGQDMGWLIEDEKLLQLFTRSMINRSLKKTGKGDPPAHLFFDIFDDFLSAHAELSGKRRIMVYQDGMDFLRAELSRRKRENGQLYFDDLLTELAGAVTGGQGLRLASQISKKYPSILIDEFQDTDQLQYRIFANIHKGGKGGGLFLIGDPKQAVYGFRGADIFTYIKARQDTGDAGQFTMTTNYRSTGKMVASVNKLFARTNPFLFAEIDFSPVKAAGKAGETPFTIGAEPVAPLNWLILPEGVDKRSGRVKKLSKEEAGIAGADLCAGKIYSLLGMGKTGAAVFGERKLSGGDIAILVRTHRQAETVRRSLDKLGITSVYIGQESVFASSEAEQLFTILSGLHGFTEPGLVCNLLATDLFACTALDIDQLRGAEVKWAEMIARLDNYLQIWKEQGILSAFYRLLGNENGVERILSMEGGERKLTNYLHLVESLQEISSQFPEPERLLRQLEEEIENSSIAQDSQQLRLESDRNLVKLVTIHKAKGLEYSLVFLPFLWSARPCKKDEHLVFHGQDQPEQLLVDLGSGVESNYELAEKERLAEDLRLLYVALTRARYSCFICWGWVSSMEKSALNYLLHSGAVPGGTAEIMEELKSSGGELVVTAGAGGEKGRVSMEDDSPVDISPAIFNGFIDNSWRVFSYSGLTKGSGAGQEQPDYDRLDEPSATVKNIDDADIDGFPRGAAAGVCIHAIFENIDFTDSANHFDIVEKQIKLSGYDEKIIPFTCNWIKDILAAELMDGFSLSMLPRRDRIDEMSFLFSLDKVNMSEFNRILNKFSIAALNPGKNISSTMHGLMTGFIDLVYRYDGRFFIADYKSNYLGTGAADYARANLAFAVFEHRYDIQYLIYTLALHRYLGSRLPDYNYEEHMGGVQYLFLRGMGPGQPVGTGVFGEYPPPALIRDIDRCFLSGQVSGDR